MYRTAHALTANALTLATVLMLATGPALGSSPDAWEEFQQNVAQSCQDEMMRIHGTSASGIEVNPFGSESYGAAIVTMDSGERLICIYDKQRSTTEMTAPFPDTTGPRLQWPDRMPQPQVTR